MIKLETPIFNTGLILTLQGQNNSFMVSMHDTIHDKHLNIKKYNKYDHALDNYNVRRTGL